MKFAAIALSLGLAGTFLVSNLQGAVMIDEDGLAATVVTDETITGTVAPASRPTVTEAMRLIDLKAGTSCKIARPDLDDHTFRPIPMNPDCAATPALSGIAYWRATEEGALIMADMSGDKVLEFAPGDGVLYESVYPSSAMITIVPARS